MKKKRIRALLCSLVLLCLSLSCGCAKVLPASLDANASFEGFTTNLFRSEISANTLNLHYTLTDPSAYGISNAPITYGSFATDEKAVVTALENSLALLESFPYERLSKENKLTYDILYHHLTLAKKGGPYLLYDEPLSPITGIQAQLPVLLAEFPFQEKQDVDTYLQLLETTPAYFDSLIAYENTKSEKGLFLSDAVAEQVIEDCRSFLSMGESNYLLSTFEERLLPLKDLSKEQRTIYLQKNREVVNAKVLPAYASLIDALTALKGTGKTEGGVCHLPDGKRYYSYVIQRETGSDRDVKELKKQIQKQLHEDFQEITLAAARLETAKEVAGQSLPFPPEQLLHQLEEKTKLSFPACPDVETSVKYVPPALEPYLSPAFYLIPAIDSTAENVIYINKAHSPDAMTLFTTLAHEGYPGHLYQTNYFASKHPAPLRSILNFGGYVEGWATYAEMCSYYLTPLPKDEAALLQKNSSFLLGLYALSDIGIHYDGWDLSDTASFFSMYGIKDEETVSDIYHLIVSDPANYLKYYIGYVEFLELKRAYMAYKGDAFSQKAFHKAVLDIGPAPFAVLRKHLLNQT